MGGRIRWALLIALLSLILAVVLGVLALTYSDEEDANATVEGPIEGNYAFASTTLSRVAAAASAGGVDLSVTGGRLSVGADGHVFWSLQMHGRDSSRTGRLSCEGTLDRTASAIVPEVRYGYVDFAQDLSPREVQTLLFNLFCAGARLDPPDTRPFAIATEAGLLVLKGPAGTISWRRE